MGGKLSILLDCIVGVRVALLLANYLKLKLFSPFVLYIPRVSLVLDLDCNWLFIVYFINGSSMLSFQG